MITAPEIPERSPPHAPYRAGAPRFTPALAPIDPRTWLKPDSEAHVLAWKSHLLDNPALSVRTQTSAEAASAEAAEHIGAAIGVPGANDLIAVSRLVSDDLVVMVPDISEQWSCGALTLTAPTFFAIDDVIGRPVSVLHGPVPDAERLSERIERVFHGLAPGTVLERFNWTLQVSAERFTPSSQPLKALARTIDPNAALEELHLRVERQTIVKLPETGAIVFTIRVCLDPLVNIPTEDRPALAQAWRGLGRDGRAYKGWEAYETLANAAFERWGV